RDAHLASVLLAGCQIEHPAEPPLDATRLICSVLFLDGARVIGHAKGGAILLTGARISGPFSCTGADLRNDCGPALNADSLRVGQGMYLKDGFTATGSGRDGAIRLVGAHIGAHLVCDGADLRNDSGPALIADGLQVGQGMYLTGGFTATGSAEYGAVRLSGAHIADSLECDGAQLSNDSGPALYADRLQVD